MPSNTVGWVTRELVENGRVERAYIGLTGQTFFIDPNLAEEVGTAATGVRVEIVAAGEPADAAGLRRADILIGLGGMPIETLGGLQEALAAIRFPEGSGDGDVEVVALRGGEVIRMVARPTMGAARGA